jgi:hypothetical protein
VADSAGAGAAKKSAGVGTLGKTDLRGAHQTAASAGDDLQAKEAGKIAAAPLADALSADNRARAAPSELAAPASPLAKAEPTAGAKGGAPAPAARALQPQAMKVGMGTPEQQARMADLERRLKTATGDERKTLLLQKCELEASLQRGPDAVLTCSMVTREFPGTPEAKRAAEIARGFSVQLPTEAPER